METRTFLLCNDEDPKLFIGQLVRTEDQVVPELWKLKIGEITRRTWPNKHYFMRKS